MNVSDLKPIDARIMKPGDPVVDATGKPGRFIAYLPDATDDYQALVKFAHSGNATAFTVDGRQWRHMEPEVFLAPDPDPIDPSPGNVDKLRKSQVGEGWRIPAHDEKPDNRAMCYFRGSHGWIERSVSGPYQSITTYRVPIAPVRMVPLSMEDFIGKPWPLVRSIRAKMPFRTIYLISSLGVGVSAIGEVAWNVLREGYELSHDHGVTWVKAEKEEQP